MGIQEIQTDLVRERIGSVQSYTAITIRSLCSFNRIFDREYEQAKAILIGLKHKAKQNSNIYMVKPTGKLFNRGFCLWREIKEQEAKLRELHNTRHKRVKEWKEYRSVYRVIKKLVELNEIRVLKDPPVESKSVLYAV